MLATPLRQPQNFSRPGIGRVSGGSPRFLARKQTLGGKRLSLSDSILSKILQFALDAQSDSPFPWDIAQLRILSIQFARVVLPLALHTIVLRSTTAWARLVSAPFSPLYYPPFLKHVKVVEFRFNPLIYGLHGERTLADVPDSIDLLRFRFSAGIALDSLNMSKSNALLTEQTLMTPLSMRHNPSCFAFFFLMNPKRFEWICPPPKEPLHLSSGPPPNSPKARLPPVVTLPNPGSRAFHIMGIPHLLRQVMKTWTHLEEVYFDGICLVDQKILTSWNLYLPSKRVTICGPMSTLEAFLLQQRIVGKNLDCEVLDLEVWSDTPATTARSIAKGPAIKEKEGEKILCKTAIVLYNRLAVSIDGWNIKEYNHFKRRLRGNA